MQASASDFAAIGCGHKFAMRVPLAKATANKCAACGADVKQHSRDEVTDEQLLTILNTRDDGTASIVLPGELAIGSYKATLAACKGKFPKSDSGTSGAAVLNCAGTQLHAFIPATQKDFDVLRASGRLFDVEWEDSTDFEIPFDDVVRALAWARERVAQNRTILVNCAQGKSRSGVMATAYVMAKLDIGVDAALAHVRASRPMVEPNPTFMRWLKSHERDIRQQPAPVPAREAQLRRVYAELAKNGATTLEEGEGSGGGIDVSALRIALTRSGASANDARELMATFDADADGWLGESEFVRAFDGRAPPREAERAARQ